MAKTRKAKKSPKAKNKMTEQDTLTEDLQNEVQIEVEGDDNDEIKVETDEDRALDKLEQELAQAKAAVAEANDQVLRSQAEFVNFKKRKEKEVEDRLKFAKEDLLKLLLPMLDDFDRTLNVIETTDKLSAVKDGIRLVNNNARKIFARIGLEEIQTDSAEYDMNLHEAISVLPVKDEDQKGKIIEVVEKGYKLKDRVIRFSKVVLGEE